VATVIVARTGARLFVEATMPLVSYILMERLMKF
jgi:hypothetical protein